MEILHYILSITEALFFIYFGIATFYIFFYAVFGLFYNDKHLTSVSKYRKFAVLIPGYKEDEVIVNVAKEAIKQDYPKEKYEVIVIADSFKKKTLDALKALPIRVVEVVFEVSKKSKALNKCMEIIGDDYEVAFILDADNIMETDVLSKINEAFDRGYHAVQGHRTAKNQNTAFAILDAVSEEINNHIFRKGHRVVGISSALIGSGMGIDYHLFKKTMATVDSVGEDKEVELKIIKKGITIEYVDSAIIYDEKTQKSDVFVNQRRRWIAAQVSYFREYFLDGFKNLIIHGNVDYFDKVLQIIQPPRILLNGILFIVTIVFWLLYIFNLSSSLFVLGYQYWLGLFLMASLALIVSVPQKFYNLKTLKALAHLPAGFILMLLSLLKIKGANKKFIHTTHSHTDGVNEKH